MLTEPSITKDQLTEQISRYYHLDVVDLLFIPKGEASWSYIVVCQDNSKYFLKIHKAKKLSTQRFQLLYDLYSQVNINQIVHPIPTTSDELEILINGYPTVLFNYIEGSTALGHKLTPNQYQQLGELLGKIHQSKNIISSFSVREQFAIPTKDEFLEVLSFIKRNESKNPIQLEALKLLYPLRYRLKQELENIQTVREQLLKEEIELVICHGEPTPDNTMIDNSGAVFLVDWDEPILAPKEKDLLFLSDALESVMRGYAKYSPDTSLNPKTKSFYTHLWNVGEIADYGGRIFIGQVTEQEANHALTILMHFINYSGLGQR